MALLVLRRTVVAGGWEGGGVHLGEAEGEVWGDVGVGYVDSAIEDRDADACPLGPIPGAEGGATRDTRAVSAGLEDGPVLGGTIEAVGLIRVNGEVRVSGAGDLVTFDVAVAKHEIDAGNGGKTGESGVVFEGLGLHV